jgi:hypothetical protein
MSTRPTIVFVHGADHRPACAMAVRFPGAEVRLIDFALLSNILSPLLANGTRTQTERRANHPQIERA